MISGSYDEEGWNRRNRPYHLIALGTPQVYCQEMGAWGLDFHTSNENQFSHRHLCKRNYRGLAEESQHILLPHQLGCPNY